MLQLLRFLVGQEPAGYLLGRLIHCVWIAADQCCDTVKQPCCDGVLARRGAYLCPSTVFQASSLSTSVSCHAWHNSIFS